MQSSQQIFYVFILKMQETFLLRNSAAMTAIVLHTFWCVITALLSKYFLMWLLQPRLLIGTQLLVILFLKIYLNMLILCYLILFDLQYSSHLGKRVSNWSLLCYFVCSTFAMSWVSCVGVRACDLRLVFAIFSYLVYDSRMVANYYFSDMGFHLFVRMS